MADEAVPGFFDSAPIIQVINRSLQALRSK
jgi:hypothetical protein